MNNKKTILDPSDIKPGTRFVLLLGLICIGIISRFLLMDWPNFKPVVPIAIFCGFLFTVRWSTALAIASMLLISDALIGFYELPLALCVYASVFISLWLGQRIRNNAFSCSLAARTASIVGSALAASIIFFLVTNAAVWMIGWYPPTVGGLLQSFAAGIPFFKFTVAGNLSFTLLLFATYFLFTSAHSRRHERQSVNLQEISMTGLPRTSSLG